jgi:ATP-dependent DNA helicase RecQ
VLRLVNAPGCQTNALVAHFGEVRAAPCGHCSRCRAPGVPSSASATGGQAPVAGPPDGDLLDAPLDRGDLQALARAHPRALAEPRQLARFLCGLTSPATTRARLSRHALFGALSEKRFARVMAFAESVLDGARARVAKSL